MATAFAVFVCVHVRDDRHDVFGECFVQIESPSFFLGSPDRYLRASHDIFGWWELFFHFGADNMIPARVLFLRTRIKPFFGGGDH
jgi:hypothetical protein